MLQAKTRHRRQHVGGTCDHDPWSAGKLGGGSNLNPDLDLAQHLQAVLDLAFQDFLLLEHGFVAFENDVIFNQVRRGRMPEPIFCLLLHAPSRSGALLVWHKTNVRPQPPRKTRGEKHEAPRAPGPEAPRVFWRIGARTGHTDRFGGRVR